MSGGSQLTRSINTADYVTNSLDTSNTNVVRTIADFNPNDEYVSPGSGFIVSDHVIATAAHCVYDLNTTTNTWQFPTTLTVSIYGTDANLNSPNTTYTAKEIHVPADYVTINNTTNHNYDYALIYVEEDLLEDNDAFNLGYVSDEFIDAEAQIYSCGFTTNNNITSRYCSTGNLDKMSEVINFNNNLIIEGDPITPQGKSGGVVYYECPDGNKTAVGILFGGGIANDGTILGLGAIRITPTISRFLLSNPNIN